MRINSSSTNPSHQYIMKATLVLILSIIGTASVYGAATGEAAPAIKDTIQALSKKCAADHKLTPEQAQLSSNQNIPENEAERCYLECVYSGVKLIHKDEFNLEGAEKLVASRFQDEKEKEVATQLVKTCAKEIKKGEDKCHLGKAIRECFVHNGKEVNFFPTAA